MGSQLEEVFGCLSGSDGTERGVPTHRFLHCRVGSRMLRSADHGANMFRVVLLACRANGVVRAQGGRYC